MEHCSNGSAQLAAIYRSIPYGIRDQDKDVVFHIYTKLRLDSVYLQELFKGRFFSIVEDAEYPTPYHKMSIGWVSKRVEGITEIHINLP